MITPEEAWRLIERGGIPDGIVYQRERLSCWEPEISMNLDLSRAVLARETGEPLPAKSLTAAQRTERLRAQMAAYLEARG
jgi:hypothetical protein